MTALFYRVLTMSVTAGLVILAVLLLRLLLLRAPAVFRYALWGAVLVRLLCPVGLPAPVSLLGLLPAAVRGGVQVEYPAPLQTGAGWVATPVPAPETSALTGVYASFVQSPGARDLYAFLRPGLPYGAVFWVVGALLLALVNAVWLLRLHRRLVGSVRLEKNVYLADHIATPFVAGLWRPCIYLPSSLPDSSRRLVLAHERAHIRRGDPAIKLLAFAALCLHWFNPLVWLAWGLAMRDMETACDEAVLRHAGKDTRAEYAALLLQFAAGRQPGLPTPLYFGEGAIRFRVRHALHGKQAPFWGYLCAVFVLGAGAFLLLTNPPAAPHPELAGAEYGVDAVLYDADSLFAQEQPTYTLGGDYSLYQFNGWDQEVLWSRLGQLEPLALTRADLLSYLPQGAQLRGGYRLQELTSTYWLRLKDGAFYLACRTQNGDTLLGCGHTLLDSGPVLRWLVRLKSLFEPTGFDTGFYARSLAGPAGGPVNCFASWQNEKYPGYAVIGFAAAEDTQLGYAVFEVFDDGACLRQFRLYSTAAGIRLADDPAVLADATSQPTPIDATFSVLLSCNPALARIDRVVDEGTPQQTVLHTQVLGSGAYAMELLPWADTDGAGKTVKIVCYDGAGQLLPMD